MKLDQLNWSYPCGCGDTPDPRAEVKNSNGQFRIKKAGAEYFVQRFGPNGVALNKDADGVPQYEPITESELVALIA